MTALHAKMYPITYLALAFLMLLGCEHDPITPDGDSAATSLSHGWSGMPAEIGPVAHAETVAKKSIDHIDAKGINIVTELTQPGNPLTTNIYRFHAKSIDNKIVGRFRTQGLGPEGLYGDSKGSIVCVGVTTDGMTARVGGYIVTSETNVDFFPDFTGTWAIWTVALAEDGSALASNTFLGAPEEVAHAHCENTLGFEPPLQETTGIVQIRMSAGGAGLKPAASN